MRLATFVNGMRDGELAVVSSDNLRALAVPSIAPTLQVAIERWADIEPQLRWEYSRLESAEAPDAFRFADRRVAAPLPRAWQWLDGSAYNSHGDLMQKVFKMDPVRRTGH